MRKEQQNDLKFFEWLQATVVLVTLFTLALFAQQRDQKVANYSRSYSNASDSIERNNGQEIVIESNSLVAQKPSRAHRN